MTENVIVDRHSSVMDPGFLIEDVSLRATDIPVLDFCFIADSQLSQFYQPTLLMTSMTD